MAQTLLDIITGALEIIGQAGIGQSISPEQSAQGLRFTKDMLENWSVQKLMLFVVSNRVVNLSATTQDYLLGPTGAGAFLGTRPTFIEAAQAVIPGSVQSKNLTIASKAQWDAIDDLGAQTSLNGTPSILWVEYTFPSLTLHFWPIPSNQVIVRMGAWEQLQQFDTIFDELQFPPAYAEAIKWNLAKQLASAYDQPITQNIVDNAANSMIQLQKINAQTLAGALDASQTLTSPNTGSPIQ